MGGEDKFHPTGKGKGLGGNKREEVPLWGNEMDVQGAVSAREALGIRGGGGQPTLRSWPSTSLEGK